MVSVASLLPHALLGAFRSKSGAPLLYTFGKVKLLLTGAGATAAMASALGGWWAFQDEDRAAFVAACTAKFDRPAAAQVCAHPAPAMTVPPAPIEAETCRDPFAVDMTSGGGAAPCGRIVEAVDAPDATPAAQGAWALCRAAPAESAGVAAIPARVACGCVFDVARRMSDANVDIVRAFRARLEDPDFDRRDRLGFPLPLRAAFIDRAGGAAAGMAAAYFDGAAKGCGLRGF